MRYAVIALAAFCAGQDDLRKIRQNEAFALTPGRGRCFHRRLLAGGSVEINVEAKPDGGVDLYLLDSENFVRFVKGGKPQPLLAREGAVAGKLTLDLSPGNWFLVLRGRAKVEGGTDIDGDDLVDIWLSQKVGGSWGGLLAFLSAVDKKDRAGGGGTPAKVRLDLNWSYSENALKRAEAHEAEVRKKPGNFISVTPGEVFSPSPASEGACLGSFTLWNDSDLDLCVVKVRITYFRGDREVGSRKLILQGPRFSPRKSRVTGGASLKEGIPRSYTFSYDPAEAGVSGKADRAEVTVLEVRPE